MFQISLKGSYYEMGVQYGKVLKEANFRLPKITKNTMELGLKSKEHVESIFPEYLEELQGIATAASLDFEKLCAFALVIQEGPNCSMFAIQTLTKEVYFGRNYDMYYCFEDHLDTTFSAPKNSLKSVSHADIFVGREDGINEKGLGVAQTGIVSYLKPGLSFWVSIRYILDKCQTVKEGVDFLTDIPHYSTMTYLLAKSSGEMAVVEVGPNDNTAILEPVQNFLVSTNHYNQPKMQKVKIHEPFDSKTRYDYIYKALEKLPKKVDEKYFKKILSSHKGMVCSHRDNIKLGTLWSVVFNLNTLDIWRAEGHPCKTKYKEDTRLKEAMS
jgi:predicted choloylglycine hydrolase